MRNLNRNFAPNHPRRNTVPSVNSIYPSNLLCAANDSTYDELNRPVRIVGPSYTDATYGPIRPLTQYTYDTLGNLTQVAAGRTDSTGTNLASDNVAPQATVAYDDFGRKIKETDPLAKFWSTTYDSNNNVTQVIDAKNQITSYIWGYGHQLTSRTATGDAIGYARNTLGQVLIAQSPTVTYRYSYDPAHRLQSVTDSRANKKLTYSYSPGGLLNKMLDSDNNETDYLYDPVGRLSGIWAPNLDYVSFNYDNGGRLTEKWFPNGVDTQYNWNADNTLASLTNKMSSTVISSHIYTYDVLGNRQTNTETVNGVATPYKYVYDELNRLTEVRNNSTSALIESTSYDPLNNRLAKSNGVTVTAYVYDSANQLKEIHSGSTAGPLLASLSYDFNGSLTSRTDTGLALVYDGLNRLTQATLGTTVSSYAYDDQDRRIQKTVAGTASNFLYSGPDIIAEYAAAWGTPTAQYTHGPNQDDPIIRATATTAQYFHQDGLGSVVALTTTGGTDATQRFDAWGNKLASTGAQPRFGYTGREPDAESGLMYYNARYYDPSIGRFVSRDPIGLRGGINQYAYVNGNPVNFTDPSGLCPPQSCTNALAVAGANNTALARATANWGAIQSAAATYGIDPALLAAIGVRETGVQNIAQIGGGQGAGVFQIDLGQNPNVTSSQAFNIPFAANFAANMLATNQSTLAAAHPNLSPTQLLQATAASYNFGTGNISGNPNTIDVGTTGGNYGSNVLGLMTCFQVCTASTLGGVTAASNSTPAAAVSSGNTGSQNLGTFMNPSNSWASVLNPVVRPPK
jgi:RHS repeat-associated protein